ncbi:MAG: 3-methyl-2-oxobutanoate hydroxymethyltransferase, partial [bacterium]
MYGRAAEAKQTAFRIRRKKSRGERIVALTAYDYPTARILDEAGVDLVLVGDSAANVVHGMATTLNIGMEEMLCHTRAVARAVQRALVVADMPFLSYQVSSDEAVRNAGLFLKAGAEAVKLEGATAAVCALVRRLVEMGIPVLGHVGLVPQSVHQLGGYRLQARTQVERERLVADACELEASGCFAVVLEPAAFWTDGVSASSGPAVSGSSNDQCTRGPRPAGGRTRNPVTALTGSVSLPMSDSTSNCPKSGEPVSLSPLA